MLRRLLILLHTPMALLATAVVLVSVLTGWLAAGIAFRTSRTPLRDATVTVSGGCLMVEWDVLFQYSSSSPERTFWIHAHPGGYGLTWWWAKLSPQHPYWGGGACLWVLPIWLFALPPAALSLAGSRAKGWRSRPGVCANCRYPLGGLATCPECGRAAESN